MHSPPYPRRIGPDLTMNQTLISHWKQLESICQANCGQSCVRGTSKWVVIIVNNAGEKVCRNPIDLQIEECGVTKVKNLEASLVLSKFFHKQTYGLLICFEVAGKIQRTVMRLLDTGAERNLVKMWFHPPNWQGHIQHVKVPFSKTVSTQTDLGKGFISLHMCTGPLHAVVGLSILSIFAVDLFLGSLFSDKCICDILRNKW